MGTRSNLYAGQPGTSATTLVTSPADTVTTITYAQAFNSGSAPAALDVTMNGVQVVKDLTLAPGEGSPVFGVLGGVLGAADTLEMTASLATINVNIGGYQVTTTT